MVARPAGDLFQTFAAMTTKAPRGAAISLVLIVVTAVLFTVGWRLAMRRRYEAHRWVQTAAACLNAAVVLVWMIHSFTANVAPQIPAKLNERAYAVATVHALVGAIGLVTGMFVVLRGNELVPQRLRFKNYKPYMRGAYALYLLGTVTGVVLYVVAYGTSR